MQTTLVEDQTIYSSRGATTLIEEQTTLIEVQTTLIEELTTRTLIEEEHSVL